MAKAEEKGTRNGGDERDMEVAIESLSPEKAQQLVALSSVYGPFAVIRLEIMKELNRTGHSGAQCFQVKALYKGRVLDKNEVKKVLVMMRNSFRETSMNVAIMWSDIADAFVVGPAGVVGGRRGGGRKAAV